MSACNTGDQIRKLRPVEWGSNVTLHCGILGQSMAAVGHSRRIEGVRRESGVPPIAADWVRR